MNPTFNTAASMQPACACSPVCFCSDTVPTTETDVPNFAGQQIVALHAGCAKFAVALQSNLDKVHVPYSYGWSIILLTLLVKTAIFPITRKQVHGCSFPFPSNSLFYALVLWSQLSKAAAVACFESVSFWLVRIQMLRKASIHLTRQ